MAAKGVPRQFSSLGPLKCWAVDLTLKQIKWTIYRVSSAIISKVKNFLEIIKLVIAIDFPNFFQHAWP